MNGSGVIHTSGGFVRHDQTKQLKPDRVTLPTQSNPGKAKGLRIQASQRSDHVEPVHSNKMDENFANFEYLEKPLDNTIAFRSKEMPKQSNLGKSKTLRLHASQPFDHSELVYSDKFDEGFANFENLGKPSDNTIAYRSKENVENRVIVREG